MCQTLVEDYDCNPLDKNDLGRSVLHEACWAGHPTLVNYLLTLKSVLATVSDRDYHGLSPMENVYKNKYEIFSLFASHVPLNMDLRVHAMLNIFIAGN